MIPKSKLIFGSDVVRNYSLLSQLAGKRVFTFPDSLLRKSLLDTVIYFDEYKTYKGKVVGFSFEKKSFEVLMNNGKVISAYAIANGEEIKEYMQNDIDKVFLGIKNDFRHAPMNKVVKTVESSEDEDWDNLDIDFL